MEKSSHSVFVAKSLQDILFHLTSVSGLQLVAGGTSIKEIAEKSVSLSNISELKKYEKRERYIDFGSGVTLSNMIELGRTNMPPILYDAIESIGTEAVRNLATIGGNICAKDYYHTLWAPLYALEAQLEFKSSKDTKIIPLSKFNDIKPGYILTNIRVPYNEWDVSIFQRVGPTHNITKDSGSFAFLAESQKGVLSSVKIAFASSIVFRSHDLENKLIGTRLPLNSKFISNIQEEAEKFFDRETQNQDIKPIVKTQFLNLLRMALLHLT